MIGGNIMKRPFELILLVLIGFIIFSCHGCHTETAKDIIPHCIPISPDTIYWVEIENRFYTNDLARAQDKVQFPIVLPSYIPDKGKGVPPPSIEGSLINRSDITGRDNETEVIIRYEVYLGDEAQGYIFITESNYPFSLGDPKLKTGLELIEIGKKQVFKLESDHLLGPAIWFCFGSESVYFLVELYNFPADEAMKIVESVIGQIE
jgi:hypothetical protein